MSAGTVEIDVSSMLVADAAIVWRRVSTPAGVNDELWPIRMTFPRDIASIEEAPTEENLFRRRITLLGVLPLDWHRFGLVSVDRGRGFHERSSSLWMREWVHIRRVQPAGTGCVVSDHVKFTPRISWLAPLVAPLYRCIFERRHRRLRRVFGAV